MIRWLTSGLGAMAVNWLLFTLIAVMGRTSASAPSVSPPPTQEIAFSRPIPPPVQTAIAPSPPALDAARDFQPLDAPALPSALSIPRVVADQSLTATIPDTGIAASSVSCREDAVDEAPSVLHRVRAEYPKRALRRGLEGRVVFRLLIGTDGRVHEAEVVRAQPSDVFEEAARAAITQWRFSPARLDGQPVPVTATYELSFDLRKP